jgi:hypothetical protein
MTDSDTTPGGKTQEEIDEEGVERFEEIAAMQKHVDQISLENERLHRQLVKESTAFDLDRAAWKKREDHLSGTLGRLYIDHVDVPRPDRLEVWTLRSVAMVFAIAIFMLAWTLHNVPSPVTCPPVVECPVIEPATTGPPSATAADADGYYLPNGEGGFIRRAWPDASAYPAETFSADCHAVCEVPADYSRTGLPGRVLAVDPTHLVCVCFHSDDHWPVSRWINWERIIR